MKYLPRLLEQQILDAAPHFKSILLLGARQTGKSTLLTHLFPSVRTIVFDPVQDLYGARKDPDLFLESFPPPLILDEVQYVPELLAALKRKMDSNGMMGQYFLTGSQNFSTLRSVAESMAGRVALFQLDNLTPQEICGQGEKKPWLWHYIQDPLHFFHERKTVLNTPSESFYSVVEWLFRGSLAATIHLPTDQITRYYNSYVQTYVERDIRIQEDIRQYAEFERFLSLCAFLTAQELNSSQLGREVGVSPQTARRWLDLLERSYQWIELSAYHGNTIKRLSSKHKGYYKNTGLACYLQRLDSPQALAISPKLGALFETGVMNLFTQQLSAFAAPPHMYHWRSSGGAEVDLVLEKAGFLYPIEIKCSTQLHSNDLRGLQAFRKTYSKDSIKPALIIYSGREAFYLDKETLALPWCRI